MMCAATLGLQSIVLFLTALVLVALTDVGDAAGWSIGVGLAVLALVAAGSLRRPYGYWLGHLTQVLAVGLGFVIPVMFFLGGVFAALWVLALGLGRRVEEVKAARVRCETRDVAS
ncbi:MAG: DUF4233 domain-containing protein [Actinomycetota bacterium]|nr:DUF4233 domain-containing protein [Actinomycetota bacterium]